MSHESLVSQTSGTSTEQPEAPSQVEQTNGASTFAEQEPGFQSRGRSRRRARFLRRARELAYRDLGGLVFDLHRFSQRNDELVLAKLTTLDHIDSELRAIEASLHERQPLTVLREAGVTACPRCSAIHSSEDNFCPSCAMPSGRHADLPAGFQAAAPAAQHVAASAPPPAGAPASTPSSAPAPASAAVPTPAPAASSTPPAGGPDAGGGATRPEDGPTEIVRPSAGES